MTQQDFTREYVARQEFTFAGKQYQRGDRFDHPKCSGERLRRMYIARRIELAAVYAEEQRKPKRGPGRPRKTTQ
jgi:hypothetical protein